MLSLIDRILMLVSARIVLAILAAWILLPQTSQAGCGNYITYGHHSFQKMKNQSDNESSEMIGHPSCEGGKCSFQFLTQNFAKNQNHSKLPNSPQEHQCHGAECNGSPWLPEPITPRVRLSETDHWGALLNLFTLSPWKNSKSLPPESSDTYSIDSPFRIERPPRSV